jgi:hypothetical protein
MNLGLSNVKQITFLCAEGNMQERRLLLGPDLTDQEIRLRG